MRKMMLSGSIGGMSAGSTIYHEISGRPLTGQVPLLLFAILLALIVIGSKE